MDEPQESKRDGRSLLDHERAKKMALVFQGTEPNAEQIRLRATRARARKRASLRPRRSGYVFGVAALATAFSCGSAFAWGVSNGVIPKQWIPAVELFFDEERDEPSEARRNAGARAPHVLPVEKVKDSDVEPDEANDENSDEASTEGAEANEAEAVYLDLEEELPPDPKHGASTRLAPLPDLPADEEENLRPEAVDDVERSPANQWQRVAQALQDDDLNAAKSAADTLREAPDLATRQAATVLQAQLQLRSQDRLSATMRQEISLLAVEGRTLSVRRSANKLLAEEARRARVESSNGEAR